MTPSQPTKQPPPRTGPRRRPRVDAAQAFAAFGDPDHCSQREYAQQQGIPRATLGYWLRQDAPAEVEPQVVAFLRGPAGEQFLRRLVVAALLCFQQRGACGLRLIGSFLELAQLHHFVGSSYGALHTLSEHLQTALAQFGDEERSRLAALMPPQTITLTADENFHGPQPCLVAAEPVSNFLVVEEYRDQRDGDTWTEAIQEGVQDLPVEVVLLSSDQAKGLLRCARDGLQVCHSPDLFHGQRDLFKPLLLPLQRPIGQAEKDLAKAQAHTDSLDGVIPLDGSARMSWEEFQQMAQALEQEEEAAKRLQQAQEQHQQVVQAVRGLGDDYHPFDRDTGRPVTAEQVGARLRQHLDRVEQAAQQAGLEARAQPAVAKARPWLGALVAVVAWFWGLARQQVEELELSEEQERMVYECLLAGHYWERAARRGRTAAQRKQLQDLAQRLLAEAWQEGGPLASLSEHDQEKVRRVARQCAGLFSRSSSCVEGRNGRLSLHHHGQGRLNEARLKALTVVHNYVARRADGTTAAERFFGAKPRDVFAWLLQRLPDLPRPAAKRPKTAAEAM